MTGANGAVKQSAAIHERSRKAERFNVQYSEI